MEIDEDQAAEVFLTDMLKNVDVSFQPILVLPGTDVTSHLKNKGKPVRIGVGLESSNSTVTCQMAGVLRYRAPGAYWIEKNTKRYIPKADDHVIGVVEEQGGDFYKVNIFTGAHALLGRESFDGATKRNKPDLKRGHLVYARVALADKDLDCELTCLVKTGPKKDWSSGESVSFPIHQLFSSCTNMSLCFFVGVRRASRGNVVAHFDSTCSQDAAPRLCGPQCSRKVMECFDLP